MPAPNLQRRAKGRSAREAAALSGLRQVWTSQAAATCAAGLAVAGCGALFLDSAATVELGYTVRPSYALFVGAILVGAPLVWRGWQEIPAPIRWAAAGLFLVYCVAWLLGDNAVLASTARGGGHRNLVYLMDLGVGLGIVGLIVGLWRRGLATHALLAALAIGTGAAAVYGLYQWAAQHWGWPFSDVNNTLDSNGVSSGGGQGPGLFGWERIRGTFLEPHFFAAYLASMLPIVVFFARGRRRVPALGVALIVCALILTVSLPSWVALIVVGEATILVLALTLGWVWRAGLLSALLAAACIAVPLIASFPEIVAPATGRSAAALSQTTDFRTTTWARAENIWSRRPVLGYGPGQSSIRLARELDEPVLVSAQGLWAAALIDAGVIGLGMWALLLGGVVITGAVALYRTPTPLLAAAFAAATVAICESQTAGDRLRLPAWVLIGLLLAAAERKPGAAHRRRGDYQTRRAAT